MEDNIPFGHDLDGSIKEGFIHSKKLITKEQAQLRLDAKHKAKCEHFENLMIEAKARRDYFEKDNDGGESE